MRLDRARAKLGHGRGSRPRRCWLRFGLGLAARRGHRPEAKPARAPRLSLRRRGDGLLLDRRCDHGLRGSLGGRRRFRRRLGRRRRRRRFGRWRLRRPFGLGFRFRSSLGPRRELRLRLGRGLHFGLRRSQGRGRFGRHGLLDGRGRRRDRGRCGLAHHRRRQRSPPGHPLDRPGDQERHRHHRRHNPPRHVEQPEADGYEADEDEKRGKAKDGQLIRHARVRTSLRVLRTLVLRSGL